MNFFETLKSIHHYNTRQDSKGDFFMTCENTFQYALRACSYVECFPSIFPVKQESLFIYQNHMIPEEPSQEKVLSQLAKISAEGHQEPTLLRKYFTYENISLAKQENNLCLHKSCGHSFPSKVGKHLHMKGHKLCSLLTKILTLLGKYQGNFLHMSRPKGLLDTLVKNPGTKFLMPSSNPSQFLVFTLN